MKKILAMSVMASSIVMASGYKIPETSVNSVALGGANIAHTQSADAAYDNPANMVFMQDTNHMEADLMYVGTSATNFKGKVSGTGPHDLNSQEQTFILPSLHYVSPKLGDNGARIGVSVVVPGGLTREWKAEPAKTVAEEFTLEIVEVNPTAAFQVTDTLGFAVGFRIVHTNGVVKSDGIAIVGGTPNTVSRDMTGDSTDIGYNLALAYHPTNNLEFGLTYRSNVNLSVEGNAKLNTSYDPFAGAVPKSYDGDGKVSVPLPASFSAAVAYTFPTKTTLEFVYEKTMWSTYKSLDFKYDGTEGPVLGAIFGTSIQKNWKDTNAFRLGLTQELDSLTLMAGFVIDETPTPESTLNFESPGSDAMSVSLGGRYAISDSIDIGLAALYSMKEDRTVSTPTNTNGIDGEFSNSNALLVSAGVGFKF